MRIRAVLPVNFYFRRKSVRPITPTNFDPAVFLAVKKPQAAIFPPLFV